MCYNFGIAVPDKPKMIGINVFGKQNELPSITLEKEDAHGGIPYW